MEEPIGVEIGPKQSYSYRDPETSGGDGRLGRHSKFREVHTKTESVSKNRRPHNHNRDDRFTVDREPAILVGGYRPEDLLTSEKPLEELERLAETAGARRVGSIVQKIRGVRPDTYIGPGKVEEVKELVEKTKAGCVLFDHDLTPAQGRTLDELIGVKVMDRTDLILDIFASRARSRMAKVQVSLAMNEYRLPRLRRLWTHLERQTGGIGMRGGPGERQIETDRRKVLKTIRDLKKELKEISARKERTVSNRGRENYLVALVGYTNAGKSTLMQALTGEQVLIEDKLFATLDTKTTNLRLGNGITGLLSDTVGFIRRLPHHLVASFHATLEEARAADLLLHVVDASSPHAREQMASVEEVLGEVGAKGKETLLIFNKIDALTQQTGIEYHQLCREFPNSISTSALNGDGLENVRAEIRARAREAGAPVSLRVHVGDGKALAYIATHFFEDRREMDDEWITLWGRATDAVLARLRSYGESVKFLSGPETIKDW